MWLAERLGHVGPLKELMRLIPYPEYLMWMARRDAEWDRPSRSDYYVMKLIDTVYTLMGAGQADLNGLKIKFQSVTDKIDPTVKSEQYVEERKREAAARAEIGLQRGRGPRPGGKKR